VAVQDVTTAPRSCGAGAPRRRPARREAVAVALAALALAGCSAESGAAAVVDGTAIPVADVHTAAAELGRHLPEPPSPSSVLAVLVAEPTVVRVAGEHGVVASDQQVQELLDQISQPREQGQGDSEAAPSDEPATEFSEPSAAVARFSILEDGLQALPDAQQVQAELIAELDALDVEVNPRFGTLDFTTGGIAPVQHPWLVPAPEATAP
jgi:hypothetical protein